MTYIYYKIFYKLAAALAFLFLGLLLRLVKNYFTQYRVASMITIGPFKNKKELKAARKRQLQQGYLAIIYKNRSLLILVPAIYFMLSGAALALGWELYYPEQISVVIFPLPLVIAYFSKYVIDYFLLSSSASGAAGYGISTKSYTDILRNYQKKVRINGDNDAWAEDGWSNEWWYRL